MSKATPFDTFWEGLYDNNGAPIAAGKVRIYVAGTSFTTVASVWADRDKVTSVSHTANSALFTLNAYGRLTSNLYGDGLYGIVILDANDNPITAQDYVLVGNNDVTIGLSVGSDKYLGDLFDEGYDVPIYPSLVQARGPIYNVRAYGALGDGLTDDRTAIQLAIDTASANGGGSVYFPIGTYLIGAALTPKSYVNWYGDGIKSIIKQDENGYNMIKGSNVTDASFRYFKLDGNKLNLTGTPDYERPTDATYQPGKGNRTLAEDAGFHMTDCKRITIEHVAVHDIANTGMYFLSTSDLTDWESYLTEDITIRKNDFRRIGYRNTVNCISHDGSKTYWVKSSSGASDGIYYLDSDPLSDAVIDGKWQSYLDTTNPAYIFANNVPLRKGSAVNSLNAGQWQRGKFAGDGLTYNTIYIRLLDSSNPDDKSPQETFVKWTTPETPYSSVTGLGQSFFCIEFNAGQPISTVNEIGIARNILIERNTFQGSENTTVQCARVDYATLKDNIFTDIAANGIQNGNLARHHIITGNIFYGFCNEFHRNTEGHGISILTNISGVSVVGTGYTWTVCADQADTYYLDQIIPEVIDLKEYDGVSAFQSLLRGVFTAAGLCNLANGTWAMGRSAGDSLLEDHLYVRLTTPADPDSKTAGFLAASFTQDFLIENNIIIGAPKNSIDWARVFGVVVLNNYIYNHNQVYEDAENDAAGAKTTTDTPAILGWGMFAYVGGNKIHNSNGIGIKLTGGERTSVVSNQIDGVTADLSAGGSGILCNVQNITAGNIGILIDGNLINNVSEHGISVTGTNFTVSNNNINYVDKIGITLTGGAGFNTGVVSGNTIANTGTTGITCAAQNVSIANNVINTTVEDGIYITAAAADVTIVGNTVPATPATFYDLSVEAGADRITVGVNTFTGAGAGVIEDTGNNCIINNMLSDYTTTQTGTSVNVSITFDANLYKRYKYIKIIAFGTMVNTASNAKAVTFGIGATNITLYPSSVPAAAANPTNWRTEITLALTGQSTQRVSAVYFDGGVGAGADEVYTIYGTAAEDFSADKLLKIAASSAGADTISIEGFFAEAMCGRR